MPSDPVEIRFPHAKLSITYPPVEMHKGERCRWPHCYDPGVVKYVLVAVQTVGPSIIVEEWRCTKHDTHGGR